MRRKLLIAFLILLIGGGVGLYFFSRYWVHRYDELIERQASIYKLEKGLVWSVIYEETYFRAWMLGAAEEVGLMQITPAVAKIWAKETGFKEFEQQANMNVVEFLKDPERNIQIGCWYLETQREKFREFPAERAMMLAAYNAGPSRIDEWTKGADPAKLTEDEFVARIGIPSTKAYVASILQRFKDQEAASGQKK